MKNTKIILVVCLSCMMLGGCASHKETISEPVKTYRLPRAHIELHKRLLSQQKQLMLSKQISQDLLNVDDNGNNEEK